jgi:hypothetical protein
MNNDPAPNPEPGVTPATRRFAVAVACIGAVLTTICSLVSGQSGRVQWQAVSFAFVAAGVAMALAQRRSWGTAESIFKALKTILEVVVIVVGGAWAFQKFVVVDVHSMDHAVDYGIKDITSVSDRGRCFVVLTLRMKNLGAFPIDVVSSHLRFIDYDVVETPRTLGAHVDLWTLRDVGPAQYTIDSRIGFHLHPQQESQTTIWVPVSASLPGHNYFVDARFKAGQEDAPGEYSEEAWEAQPVGTSVAACSGR